MAVDPKIKSTFRKKLLIILEKFQVSILDFSIITWTQSLSLLDSVCLILFVLSFIFIELSTLSIQFLHIFNLISKFESRLANSLTNTACLNDAAKLARRQRSDKKCAIENKSQHEGSTEVVFYRFFPLFLYNSNTSTERGDSAVENLDSPRY